MNLWKITRKTISTFLLFFFLFITLLIIKSADWFLDYFYEVAFSTALYQLFSPMKGTAPGILNTYLDTCLYPAVKYALLFTVFYTACDILLKVLILEYDVRIGKREFCLRIGNRFRLISKIILGLGMLVLCILSCHRIVLVGIPEYIDSITHSSNIYEAEYIDSKQVSIEFPERRNLLLIYMESMESTYASTEAGGAKYVNYIPGLTALANENVHFSNDDDLGGATSYPKTTWTMSGLLASSSGVNYQLPIEGNTANNYENFLPGLTTLGDILRESGYHNYFMCGSDAVFGGRADFYIQHGNYTILDYYGAIRDGIIPSDYSVFWGMEDKYLYEYAKQALTEIASSSEPFNFTMLTVDTHHPDGYVCSLCDNAYPEQFANAITCADKQVCEFIDWVKEQDWYENTTIVITGDHLSMNADFWDDIGDYERTIYNCFINLPKGLVASRTTNREFSTMDMFPSIIAAIGANIEGDRLGLGTNLFSAEQTLPEKLGKEVFYEELSLYSKYYYSNFIITNK